MRAATAAAELSPAVLRVIAAVRKRNRRAPNGDVHMREEFYKKTLSLGTGLARTGQREHNPLSLFSQ